MKPPRREVSFSFDEKQSHRADSSRSSSPSSSFINEQIHQPVHERLVPASNHLFASNSSDDLYPWKKSKVDGEYILYEGWVLKHSRWLGKWRRRWLLLTSSRLRTYASERGYSDSPTEEIRVLGLRGARALHEDESIAATTSTPLSCVFAAESPRCDKGPAAMVQIRLVDSSRSVILDVGPNAMASVDGCLAASELITAVVNAVCAAKTRVPQYLVPGTMHSFEPRGLVTLRDRYVMDHEIGRGTFGTVFKGRCLQSGRTVAIKKVSLLPPRGWRGSGANPARAQVLEEVAILREVRSPHVVSLLNFLEDGGTHGCLVMELLPGGNLYAQVLERYSRHRTGADGYSERELREIMRMALSGLAAVHDLNVVHRDLKPENVLLLDRRGGLIDLRIADFGVARRLSGPGGTARGIVGSTGYMAPEVLSDKPYGLAADVWSMGVILFTLLSGRMPFWHDDETLEEAAIKEGAWSFADANWDEVSYEAKDMVRRLLTTDPMKRPSAQEALDMPWLRVSPRDPIDGPLTAPREQRTLARTSADADSPGGPRTEPRSSNAGGTRRHSLAGSKSLLTLPALERRKNEHTVGRPAPPPKGREGGAASGKRLASSSHSVSNEILSSSSAATNRTPSTPTSTLPHERADGGSDDKPERSATVLGLANLMPKFDGTGSVPSTPTTSELLRSMDSRGDGRDSEAKIDMRRGTDERGQRIRMFTATLTADRAVKAGLGSFRYNGELADAVEEGADAKMRQFGGTLGKVRHGHGEAVYDSGNRYVGQWQQDRRHGVGRFEFACGDVYDGQWADGRYHGVGQYTSPGGDGDEYEGQWHADKPHGHGRYKYRATGEVYEGEWFHGMRDGKGREIHADGTVVEGAWECGERTSLALSNTGFLTGIDAASGKRIRMFTATLTCERVTKADLLKCEYEGDTVEATDADEARLSAFSKLHLPGRKRHGQGRVQYECGNVFIGQWVDDLREGFGTFWYACGDKYEGQWKAGKYEGAGKYTGSGSGGASLGGDSYEGEWKADEPHGHGRYTYRETGEAYEGQWREGKYHGEGSFYGVDGAVKVEGEWRDGLLVPRWQRKQKSAPMPSES